MTKLFQQVVEDIRTMPAEDQDRVAEAVLAFLREWQDDGWRAA
jgi:hypothetical protein